MRESMVFYKSFADAIRNLDDETRLACYEAVIGYALDGVEPDDLAGVPKAIFTLIRPQIDANNRRYEDGCKGGRPKKPLVSENDENEKPMVLENTENEKPMVLENAENEKPVVIENGHFQKPNENENDNVNVNENDKKREKRTRFTPPSVDDVRLYCRQMGYGIDPEAFVDFYTSKGWKVGNQAMKDWKSAVRTWEKRDKKDGRASPVKFDPAQYLLDKIAGGGFDD